MSGITVSSREQKHFRDGIVKIAATKYLRECLPESEIMRASIPERIPENPEMSSLKSPMEEALTRCITIWKAKVCSRY